MYTFRFHFSTADVARLRNFTRDLKFKFSLLLCGRDVHLDALVPCQYFGDSSSSN